MILAMRYDFTKVQETINGRGLTLDEVSRLTRGHLRNKKDKLHYTTISKALARNSAHQSTARALVSALGLTMDDIQVKEARVA